MQAKEAAALIDKGEQALLLLRGEMAHVGKKECGVIGGQPVGHHVVIAREGGIDQRVFVEQFGLEPALAVVVVINAFGADEDEQFYGLVWHGESLCACGEQVSCDIHAAALSKRALRETH